MSTRAASQARAYEVFKSFLDLEAADLEAALARLAAADPEVHAQVLRLQARDREEDVALDRLGAGANELLAHELLTSMVSRGELDPGDVPERIGPYRLLSEIGRGGMGVVYEAEQDEPKRRVAIKTSHRWLETPELEKRFRFEVQALASLRHRAIPRLFEVREESGTTWMVMELVHGEALDVYAGPLPVALRLRLLIEIADGIAHAHEAGIVHRDLKPANFVVSEGHPRILDFGLASSLTPEVGASDQGAGTLAYMAPEVLEGEVADRRADIYGLGVILYELLTGERPVASTGRSRAELRANKRLPPPRVSHRRGLGRDLDFILARAMHPDPGRRYSDASDFRADLEHYLAGRPVSARRPTIGYRLTRLLQRQRHAFLAVGVTLVLAAVVAISVALFRSHDEAQMLIERERRAAERFETLRTRDAELRARGEVTEADALFTYFAQSPDHSHTRTLHEAWLWRGQAMRDRIRPSGPYEPIDPHFAEASSEAFAEAYTTAPDHAGSTLSLLELGRLFLRLERFDGVRRVLELLKDPGQWRTEVDALRVASLAERRDVLAVTRVDHQDTRLVAPILERFVRTTALGVTATMAARMHVDGGLATGILDQPARRFRVLGESGQEVAHIDLPPNTRYNNNLPRLVDGLEACVVIPTHDGRTRVTCLEPDMSGFSDFVDLPVASLHTCLGWTGPEGRELLLGTAAGDRALYHYRAGTLVKVPPEVIGPASDVNAMLRDDFDGDGRPEIVVALGPWRAYDLRVLRQTPDAFELVARKRLGSVIHLEAFTRAGATPLIAAAKQDAYPNPGLLGAKTPFGPPPGVYLLELKDGELIEHQRLDLPQAPQLNPTPHQMLVGDFDGDGLEDLVLGSASGRAEYVIIKRQLHPRQLALPQARGVAGRSGRAIRQFAREAEPTQRMELAGEAKPTQRMELAGEAKPTQRMQFAEVVLGGMSPLDVYPLEGRDALLVRTFEDLQGRVLGLGEELLPPSPVSDPPVADPPAPDGELALEWRRASELDSMGLSAAAARRLEAASRLSSNPRSTAEALIWAGELLTKAGQPALAARLFSEVLESAPAEDLLQNARLGRARAYLALHAVAAAVTDLEQTPLEPDGEGSRPHLLEVGARTSPSLDIIAEGKLDPSWDLWRPGTFVRTGFGAKVVRATSASGDGVLASMPLRYGGGAITVRAGMVIEHLELGAALKLRLRAGDREVAWFTLSGYGGGLFLERTFECGPQRGLTTPRHTRRFHHDRPAEDVSILFGILPTRTGAELVCQASGEAGTLISRRLPIPQVDAGELTLEWVSEGAPGGAVTLVRTSITDLSIGGLVPVASCERPPNDTAFASRVIARALFEQDYASAAAFTALSTPWSAADFFLAQGDPASALTRLSPLLDEDFWSSHELLRRLRLWPREWLPIALSLDRRRALEALTTSWEVGVRYLENPDVVAFLSQAALSEVSLERTEDRLVVVAMLRTGLRMGFDGSSFRHALRLAEEEPPAGRGPERAALTLLAAAHHDRAGDEPRARALFERWRHTVPFPELAFESLPHDPDAGGLARWLD